jgi:hypothetical protein
MPQSKWLMPFSEEGAALRVSQSSALLESKLLHTASYNLPFSSIPFRREMCFNDDMYGDFVLKPNIGHIQRNGVLP